VAAALAIPGCGIFDPSADEPFPEPLYIDENPVLEISEAVPAEGSPVFGETGFVFHVGPLVRGGGFNDAVLSYKSPNGCDQDVRAFDFSTDTWDALVSVPNGLTCTDFFSSHAHLFSGRGLSFADYIDEPGTMRIHGWIVSGGVFIWDIASPGVRAVRLREEYYAIPLVQEEFYFTPDFAFGGDAFWVSSGYASEARINKFSLRGIAVRQFSSRVGTQGLTYGDGSLWTGSSTEISRMNEDGEVVCSFSAGLLDTGEESVRDLAWGENVLWMLVTNINGGSTRIVAVDPGTSCSSGTAEVLMTIGLPEAWYGPFAWTGTHFLAIESSYRDPVLHLIDREGKIERSYDAPVSPVYDLAWDGEAVVFLCGGPKSLNCDDRVITRFKLR
jgi:hypothetical protein